MRGMTEEDAEFLTQFLRQGHPFVQNAARAICQSARTDEDTAQELTFSPNASGMNQ